MRGEYYVGSSPLTRGKLCCVDAHHRIAGLIPAHAGKTRSARETSPPDRAHPRSRGENRDVGRVRRTGQGSSPLTRGKRPASVYLVVFIGLIPAHAGKTVRESTTQNVPWAHPRSRGENLLRWLRVRVARGSSPLTRGKLVTCRAARRCRGLIPAHAGKTWRRGAGRPTRRAHPRSRGENRSTSSFSAGAAGSSPLTRGKLHLRAQQSRRDRLIPAHAGKTGPSVCAIFFAGAHPRSRGENLIRRDHRRVLRGSSPLTRGKPVAGTANEPVGGLIPAHAGKTPAGWRVRTSLRAHPRSRGENHCILIVGLCIAGSSPLTRGKLQHRRVGHNGGGLIPAHAGKTRFLPGCHGRGRAHPRSRGENHLMPQPMVPFEGSSPLTRGKRAWALAGVSLPRLIPAHAGKTRRPRPRRRP